MKVKEIAVKSTLIIATTLLITVILVKRFKYFNPSRKVHYFEDKDDQIEIHSFYLDHIYSKIFTNNKANNKKIIIFCSGNSGNNRWCYKKIFALSNLGYTVIAFDYTGFGKTEGNPNEQSCYNDSIKILDFVISEYKKSDIVLYGFSLGGAIASRMAILYGIKNLVLDSPIPSVKTLIHETQPYILSFFSFLFGDDLSTEKNLDQYCGKVMLIRSQDDEIIPYNSLNYIAQKCTRVINTTGKHSDGHIDWNKVDDFLQNN